MARSKDAGYGQAMMNMIANQVWAFGRIHIVVNSSDTDEGNYNVLQDLMTVDNDGKVRLFTSLSDAYDACESNNNDVILLDANSTHSLSAGIAWSKNRIHVIGMDGGDRLVQQGAKVQLATAATTQYVIKVTGVRNSFRNIKFINAATDATALTVLEEGGEGNLYKNCSFVFGVVNNLDLTTAHEVVCWADSATFLNCLFWTETLLTSAARSVFLIDQVTASQEFKSNIIKDCIFVISSSDAGAYLLEVAATTDVLFSNFFINCEFMASVDSAGWVALTNAVTSVASLVKGCVGFRYPAVYNCTNFSANNSTNFEVVAPAVSNNAFEWILPA